MFTVVACGILFTGGVVVRLPWLTDAAFNPFVDVALFLSGLVFYRWRDTRR